MEIEKLEIERFAGTRPTGNVHIVDYVWFIDKGKQYDKVNFKIKECPRLRFWLKTLCVPVGYPEERCRQLAEIFARHITQKDIDAVNDMLDEFDMYGCD